ncbi:MAG: glucose-6-phosphate dehydrogenase [Clostridiaceae bacterium]|nr:glucose-6-phosphate dehydrogenase [Clostridiaceae bacterium]
MKKDNAINNLSSVMIIFGGTGDLTHRKLMPALYNLVIDNLLPENFAVVAIGRREKTDEQYRNEVFESISNFSRKRVEKKYWNKLRDIIYYRKFDFTDMAGYKKLSETLGNLSGKFHTGCGSMGCNRIFYLAVSPQYFETIVHGLEISGLANDSKSWVRLVIEKPFGKDLQTAKKLNKKLLEVFSEKDIYRIDHYLGKEMIQNIMVLRFCNSVFGSLWSNKYIDNIQISLCEKHGIGTRGEYYEGSGAMRDMVQNHIVQILSLVAMEPPVNLETDSIRTEKLKVVQAIDDFTPELLRDNVVFGQYGKGYIDGIAVPGYRQEDKVSPNSNTETFVALKLHINNFRWAGTPFYIRTGKRLNMTSSEIVVQFKSLPKILYFKDKEHLQEPNLLVIRIQPNVGVFFQFNTRDFNSYNNIVSTKMDASQINRSSGNTPEAYERLIYDILRGDSTLFSRWDEVEASWKFADKIIEYGKEKDFNFPNYDAGSMGPVRAFELLAKDGRKWLNI